MMENERKFALWDNRKFAGMYTATEIFNITDIPNNRIAEIQKKGRLVRGRWQITASEEEVPEKKQSGINPRIFRLYDKDGNLAYEGTSKEVSEKIGVTRQYITNAANENRYVLGKFMVKCDVEKSHSNRTYGVIHEPKRKKEKIGHEVPLEQKDPLSRVSYLARQAGMSYGQYVATHPEVR